MTIFHQEGELKAPHACDTECDPPPPPGTPLNRAGASHLPVINGFKGFEFR